MAGLFYVLTANLFKSWKINGSINNSQIEPTKEKSKTIKSRAYLRKIRKMEIKRNHERNLKYALQVFSDQKNLADFSARF